MAALLIGSSCAAADKDIAQWLVVTAPAFRESLAPLVEHRRAEGLKVVVIESTNVLTLEQIRQTNAHPLQAHLARLCQQHPGRSYVLLVGAAAVRHDRQNAEPAQRLPLRLPRFERRSGGGGGTFPRPHDQ